MPSAKGAQLTGAYADDVAALKRKYSNLKPGKVFGVSLSEILEMPTLVSSIIGFLNRFGVKREGIYRVAGKSKVINKLIGLFTKGKKVDFIKLKADPYSIADTLKIWFRMLPAPLIQTAFFDECVALDGRLVGSRQLCCCVVFHPSFKPISLFHRFFFPLCPPLPPLDRISS